MIPVWYSTRALYISCAAAFRLRICNPKVLKGGKITLAQLLTITILIYLLIYHTREGKKKKRMRPCFSTPQYKKRREFFFFCEFKNSSPLDKRAQKKKKIAIST
ncbi:unnamed protein product [Tuber melanosporum]|uniref:(Perigord truffle) hypothetical protein n=1 Tax=Tuber melanosporum (strain Mel28) TaxID=656061 RepID=D5G641_TUBMM|nr:uncharacterized protein GSTUM_00001758001 [Tuber melanosporum]CAZ79984.1 unnamed protein product [Tuber melanosporum]